MKIALCFSGQPRYLKESYEGIYDNILNKYSPDVFVHTWWDDSMPNQKMNLSSLISYGREYYWEENTIGLIQQYYSPKEFFYEPQIQFQKYNNVDYEMCNPFNIHSMFYSLEKSNEIKKNYEIKNKFLYDAVIRCRFDTKFIKFEIDFFDINLNYVNLYDMGNGYPNDQFAISTSENMNIYSSVYRNLDKYQKSGHTGFVGERLLKHHLEMNNLNWNNPDIKGKININIIVK